MTTPITQHEGKKYLRKIQDVPQVEGAVPQVFHVDVYCVIEAFGVTCPAVAHALKKLLCAGQRSKGSRIEDLTGAIAAINRAIELETRRERLLSADAQALLESIESQWTGPGFQGHQSSVLAPRG